MRGGRCKTKSPGGSKEEEEKEEEEEEEEEEEIVTGGIADRLWALFSRPEYVREMRTNLERLTFAEDSAMGEAVGSVTSEGASSGFHPEREGREGRASEAQSRRRQIEQAG